MSVWHIGTIKQDGMVRKSGTFASANINKIYKGQSIYIWTNIEIFDATCILCLKISYLRNEFHFSGVHGAMNRSGSRAK